MAESESGQDKTEEPTEKRRREAREKGQLPRSRELNTLAILMAGAGGLLIYGADLAGALLRLMRSNFELSRETAMNTESMLQLLGASAYLAAQGLWPILLMLLVAAIVGPIALGGWLFSMDALQPKFSRLNPLSGLKRMFSAKSLLELSKALIKFWWCWRWPCWCSPPTATPSWRWRTSRSSRRSCTACGWSAGAPSGWPATCC